MCPSISAIDTVKKVDSKGSIHNSRTVWTRRDSSLLGSGEGAMVDCIEVGIRGSSDKHSDLVLNVWEMCQ